MIFFYTCESFISEMVRVIGYSVSKSDKQLNCIQFWKSGECVLSLHCPNSQILSDPEQ